MLNGSLDLLDGVDLESLEKHESFVQMQSFVSSVNKQYGIGDIARAGFRIFYLNKLGANGEDVKRGFRSLYSQDVIKEVEANLGPITDYALSLGW